MIRNYRNAASDENFRALAEDPSLLPFAFTYGGREYFGFSSEFFSVRDRSVTNTGEREDVTFLLGFDGIIEIEIRLTHYYSHGVTEWTVYFENASDSDSEIIENARSVVSFEGDEPILKGILGDHVNQYRPYSIDLSSEAASFTSDHGRATHINFPYFDLECGDGGAMLAIGWAGTWRADFSFDGEKTTYTAGAVNGLRTRLKSGERIRTALFVVAPYTVRDEDYAANLWRSWFIEHNLPRADSTGADMTPFSTCCLTNDTGLPNSDGSISERYDTWRPSLEKMIEEDAKVDFRWFDAGWYIRPDLTSAEPFVVGQDWWDSIGTWELDPEKWPEGSFRESTDFAREHGMKTLVWFEPERVTDPENLAKNFGYDLDWAIRVPGERTISNNIGDPDCFKWTVDRICKMLRENRVEMYREDNNCSAAPLWKHLDSIEGEGREGITECKFIMGHYDMWDKIIECTLSYGGCGFVDSCASGGGRNDLESMRRGVPLLRSDSDRTSTALRLSMTWGFNKWIPFCGANSKEKLSQLAPTGDSDPYIWRASYLPVLNVDSQFVQDPDQDFGVLRFGLKEWRRVSPYLLKDFYTLTPWRAEKENDGFFAFCYFDPEAEKGALLAFCQEECQEKELTLDLPFEGEYLFTDEDSGERFGAEKSLTVRFSGPREAKLLWVERK